MPVNFIHVRENLEKYSQQARLRQDQLDHLSDELWTVFSDKANDYLNIKEQVINAALNQKNIRCACPTNESLLSHHVLPEIKENYTLMAADGSQITPSRHKAIQYCLINVGLIKVAIGSNIAPQIHTTSQLLDLDQLYSQEGTLIDEETVALIRDYSERAALSDYITESPHPILTLTDGPLSLFKRKNSEPSQDRWQQAIIGKYKQLLNAGVVISGYIDKPGSDLIGHLFSLLRIMNNDPNHYDPKLRYFKGISDAELLGRLNMKSGERSAIFQVMDSSNLNNPDGLEIGFFYLNVGKEHPYLVRVEFPADLINNPEKINLLHTAIFNDTQVLENHPYPYILHRAHELAIVHLSEHLEVERMLLRAYQKADVKIGVQSNKEANKLL